MSSDELLDEDEDELELLDGALLLDEAPASVLLSELPQAARLSGRARASAAIALRRVVRMMVTPWSGSTYTRHSCPRGIRIGLSCKVFREVCRGVAEARQETMTTIEW
jgi:hypothetical protein